MIKKLTRIGNSKAIVLDKTMLDQIGIVGDDHVQLTLSENALMITAARPAASRKEFDAAANRVFKKYSKALRDLA